MTVYLLDVNVLVALAWPGHASHDRVQSWFGRHGAQGWATCPFTQCAFVRIISNPSFSARSVTLDEALRALKSDLDHPGHHFWADDLPLADAVQSFQPKLVGHQQVSDAYLLGLALHKKGTLATLDKALLSLLPQGGRRPAGVELIS